LPKRRLQNSNESLFDERTGMTLDYIYNGDSLEILKTFPDNSIRGCCVTSPPYFGLRDYGVDGQIGLEETPERYIKKLVEVFREVKRVLSDDSTLWVNIGDSFAGNSKTGGGDPTIGNRNLGGKEYRQKHVPDRLKCKDLIGIPWMLAFALRADGWYLRQDIIWEKGNAMPESVKDRCTRSHEYVFMLAKSKTYYYDSEAIKEPAVNGDPTSPRGSKGTLTENSGRRKKQDDLGKRTYSGFNERYFSKDPVTMRNKRSVWHINTRPFKEAHFAVFPEDLVIPCVLAGCPEDGIVLDPFFGSGTSGVVAKKLGRNFVGIELNPTYCGIAEKRIQNVVCKYA
jgi:DNA modification methylase